MSSQTGGPCAGGAGVCWAKAGSAAAAAVAVAAAAAAAAAVAVAAAAAAAAAAIRLRRVRSICRLECIRPSRKLRQPRDHAALVIAPDALSTITGVSKYVTCGALP